MIPAPRDSVARLSAYTPGEQPTRRDIVKLNTNENPYPPSEAVMNALRSLSAESLRRYPPPDAAPLRQRIAQLHGLTPEHVIVTNGGDELLRLVVTAYCEPGAASGGARGGLGLSRPTYSLYGVLAAIQDTPVVEVDLMEDFSRPADLPQRWNAAGCRVGMLVNPHAPSGRADGVPTLRSIAQAFAGLLLVDEAYVDFAQADALPLLRGGDACGNVLILRTLSKGYSLAGLRVGYGLADPWVIALLQKVRDSYNVDALAQHLAAAALSPEGVAQARVNVSRVVEQRRWLAIELTRRGFVVLPSESNFLLVTPPTDARLMYESLKDRGIYVRYFDQPRLRDKLRITIGSPEQNAALLAGVK